MPKLVVSYGNNTTEYQFTSYITMGRSSRCNVSIKDIKLSRVHAEIIQDENTYIIVDLQSQNGIKVNDRDMTEAILQNGDVITLGERAKITFVCENGENSDKTT